MRHSYWRSVSPTGPPASLRLCLLGHQARVCILSEQLATSASHHGPDRLPAGSALLLPLRGRILNLPAVWAGRGQCIPLPPDIVIRPRCRGLLQLWGRAGWRPRRGAANLPEQAEEAERNPHNWVQPEGYDGEEQEAHFNASSVYTVASSARPAIDQIVNNVVRTPDPPQASRARHDGSSWSMWAPRVPLPAYQCETLA